MNIKFIAVMVFFSLFISSCYFRGIEDNIHIASEAESNRSKRSRVRNITGLCKDYRECEDVCEEVYNDEGEEENEGKVDACIKLRYKTAMQFEEIVEILEEPENSLKNIETSVFSDFLDISLAPWVEKAKEASSSEAKELLIWIAKESRISQSIKKAYENFERDFSLYEGVDSLFNEINGCDRDLLPDRNYEAVAQQSNNCDALDIYNEVCSLSVVCN